MIHLTRDSYPAGVVGSAVQTDSPSEATVRRSSSDAIAACESTSTGTCRRQRPHLSCSWLMSRFPLEDDPRCQFCTTQRSDGPYLSAARIAASVSVNTSNFTPANAKL